MIPKYIRILSIGILLTFTQCEDPLDKENLGAITGVAVWNDLALATGFLNEIYDNSLPEWDNQSSLLTDDASFNDGTGGSTSQIYGDLPSNSIDIFSQSYENIRNVNILMENVITGSLEDQDLLVAQAQFFRAVNYFNLVSTYGGVPIVLTVLNQGDNLGLPRNSSSETMTQVIKDLDDAIEVLPNVYDDAGSNYGRITKGAAMAFKGRALLHWASEQFDPGQSETSRWQDAFDANNDAMSELAGNEGKGLHPNFSDLWFDESDANPEAVLLRRYTSDKGHDREAGARPFIVGTSGEAWHKATISLAEAFPMRDGVAINDASSAFNYDPVAFWSNRDPRFEATIAWNGSVWPLKDPAPNRTSDIEWSFQFSAIEGQADTRITPTGMSCRKAVDGSIPGGSPTLISGTDLIEIRFAEVMLNVAEAANEVGNGTLALQMLMDIRERAGITNGNGRFGLAAGLEGDRTAMKDAIMLERRLELAFEGKRAVDLRRRRMYGQLNGSTRRGFVINRTATFDALDPSDAILDDRVALENEIAAGNIDLNDPVQYATYFETVLRSVERNGNTDDDGDVINWIDQYYFYDIPQNDLDRNPAMEQTSGWPGGTFDPLN